MPLLLRLSRDLGGRCVLGGSHVNHEVAFVCGRNDRARPARAPEMRRDEGMRSAVRILVP